MKYLYVYLACDSKPGWKNEDALTMFGLSLGM